MIRRAVPVLLLASLSLPACSEAQPTEIWCGRGGAGILAAQAVPSATQIPCISAFPVGWSYGGLFVKSGLVRFWLDSDRGGFHAIQVELTERCDTSGAVEVQEPGAAPSGVRRFELPTSLAPRLSGVTFYTFAGGCVAVRYDLGGGTASTLLIEAQHAIELFPRKEAVSILADLGGHLCGAEAPPCVGGDGS